MDEILNDSRFAHVANDPRFKRIPKSERKVKIDKRFQSMFKDDKFNVKYTVDKRGRPISQSTDEYLKRYYDLSSEEEESSDEEDIDDTSGRFVRASKESDQEETDEISHHIKEKLLDLKVDYARGESRLLSESSSDEESDENADVLDDENVEHDWGELDKDAETTENATNRLAACNMDWDRIRAVDLMVLFSSFLPSGGVIRTVTIYPSEFGLKRMQEEEIKGPLELTKDKVEVDDSLVDESENEEGSKYHMEKLRRYQLNRLKYYYAIIVCDTAESANKIYAECDGLEYESSATKLDLRFVPDDTTFDQEPKEVCDALPEVNNYQPRYFITTALQQAKVKLTWDETNPERVEVAKKIMSGKIDDVSAADLQNYLANSSEDEEEDSNEIVASDAPEEIHEKDSIQKYKQLLLDVENQDESEKNDMEMEVSWTIDLKKKTDQLVKEKQKKSANLTPFEKYLEKKKEKRKSKKLMKRNNSDSEDSVPSDVDLNDSYFADEFKDEKMKKIKTKKGKELGPNEEQNTAELELLLADEDDSNKHFSLKKIQERESESKSKRKKNKKHVKSDICNFEDNFTLNVDDNRFAAIFTSHEYNIDPTDSHYKKTKGMETLIHEKIKRKHEEEDVSENSCKNKVKKKREENENTKQSLKQVKKDNLKNVELNQLVQTVKKIKMLNKTK